MQTQMNWIDQLDDNVNIVNDLAYKDEVVTKLKDQIDEYLTFGTPRELFKIIADVL